MQQNDGLLTSRTYCSYMLWQEWEERLGVGMWKIEELSLLGPIWKGRKMWCRRACAEDQGQKNHLMYINKNMDKKNCILWHSLRKKQRKLQWTLQQTQNTRDMWQLVVCELFSHGLYSHRCSPAEGWKGSVPEAIFVMSHLTNHCKTGWMGKASRLFQYKPMKSFLKKESYNKANC